MSFLSKEYSFNKAVISSACTPSTLERVSTAFYVYVFGRSNAFVDRMASPNVLLRPRYTGIQLYICLMVTVIKRTHIGKAMSFWQLRLRNYQTDSSKSSILSLYKTLHGESDWVGSVSALL